MNKQTNRYIEEASEEQKNLMLAIRSIIHQQVPDVIENFKWGWPVFSNPSDFTYFKTTKSYLTFGFFKFDKIEDETHLSEGTAKI